MGLTCIASLMTSSDSVTCSHQELIYCCGVPIRHWLKDCQGGTGPADGRQDEGLEDLPLDHLYQLLPDGVLHADEVKGVGVSFNRGLGTHPPSNRDLRHHIANTKYF